MALKMPLEAVDFDHPGHLRKVPAAPPTAAEIISIPCPARLLFKHRNGYDCPILFQLLGLYLKNPRKTLAMKSTARKKCFGSGDLLLHAYPDDVSFPASQHKI